MTGRARLPRRAFLRLGAALAALINWPAASHALSSGRGPRLAAGLPLSFAHHFIPDADTLRDSVHRFDAALVPACIAAELIRCGALRPLATAGQPGRAHDPEGAFTLPHLWTLAALVYRGQPPARPSLDDLFQPGALWPACGRLVIGAALLRRGCPPDDTHPGHLAQAEHDLAAERARPRFVPNPLTALAAGAGDVALALMEASPRPPNARLPAEAALAVEFDWVIPRASVQPRAAEDFVRGQASPRTRPPSALTLGPLSDAARARYADLWARLSDPTR